MKHFLFVMFEGGGNVPPQLGIARRLVGRGHVVRVLADPPSSLVRARPAASSCRSPPPPGTICGTGARIG
jgi:hypothetical protein